MTAHSATKLLVLLVSITGFATARNPGISIRLSQSLFNYALEHAVKPLFPREAAKITFSPHAARAPAGIVILFADIRLDFNTYSLDSGSYIQPNFGFEGLEAKVGFHIAANAVWKSRSCCKPYIYESGHANFTTSPMWVQAIISMSPGADGLWDFTLDEFSVDCNIQLKFASGGVLPILINDIPAIREKANAEANSAATDAIRKAILKVLDNLTPTMEKYLPYMALNCTRFGSVIPNCEDFALNLTLSSSGVWEQGCYAEIQLDGYLLYNNQSFLPTEARPFPPVVGCGTHGFSLLISGQTFGSLAAAILASGIVEGNFPMNKFANDSTYDQYIPGLAKYGHLPLYANVTLLNSSTSISGKEMRIMLGASFKILVDTTPPKLLANKTFVEAVDMVVTTTVGLSAWLGNFSTPVGVLSMLYLNFTTTVVDGVTVSNSSVGHVDVDKVQGLMQQLLSRGFQNADEFLVKGIFIIPPNINIIQLHNPHLVLGEDYLELALDVGVDLPTTAPPPVSPHPEHSDDVWQKKIAAIDLSDVPQTVSEAVEEFLGTLVEFHVRLAEITKQAFVNFGRLEHFDG